MKKIKLESESVPWRISPSYEYIEYSGEPGVFTISFIGQYSHKVVGDLINELNVKYNNNIPDNEWNKIGYSKIELSFNNVYRMAMEIITDEFGILNDKKFDYVSFKDETKIDDVWNLNNICLDSGFYEVVESEKKYLSKIREKKIKHWKLIARESIFDIVAESYKWNKYSIYEKGGDGSAF